VYQNKIFRLALSLCFLLLGCSSASRDETPDKFTGDIDTPIPTLQAGTPEPLCPRNSTYQVWLKQLNTPISECKLYFYVAFLDNEGDEKWLQIIVQPNNPFTFYDNGIVDYASINQIKPYWYRWVIKDEQGQVQRTWLAYFIKGRDGLYHTIISQPEQDWHNSFLEIFFEDINNDHVREDVTYEIVVGDFLEKVHP
jgi:hypothetical protein